MQAMQNTSEKYKYVYINIESERKHFDHGSSNAQDTGHKA